MPTPPELYTTIRNRSFDADVDLAGESELYNYMSEAELILAKKVHCTQATSAVNTVIDQREYDRPTGALKIERITWNTVKLKKIKLGDVDVVEGQSYGGVTSTGNAVYYYEYGSKIGISPLPNSVAEIKYYYLKYPTALSSSSTTFTIPEEYAHYLTDYCLWMMYLKDDLRGLADRAQAMWEDNLEKCLEDWTIKTQNDEIETVQLEEIYPTSELGMI